MSPAATIAVVVLIVFAAIVLWLYVLGWVISVYEWTKERER